MKALKTFSKGKNLIKNQNIMTPNLVSLHSSEYYQVEISSGSGISGQPIYGVTVYDIKAEKILHDISTLVYDLEEAEDLATDILNSIPGILLKNVLNSRNGMYVHALEVMTKYELEAILGQLIEEFQGEYTNLEIKKFIETLEIYHIEDDELTEEMNQENETEIYNFNIKEFLNNNL